MNTNTPQKAVAFNSNIDFTNQILININDGAAGYRSRCEGKAISLYRNGELLADGTMSTGEVGGEVLHSLCAAELTYHDDTFESFSPEDTYTLTIGDEEPIGLAFKDDYTLVTQELYDGLRPYIIGVDNTWYSQGSASTFSIAQNVQTTRKKYDIKLLPDDCLPKSVAKKSEVKSVERVAKNAQSTAQSAQSTANSAKTTAESAQSTANSAKTTAESAQSTAEGAKTTINSLNNIVVKASDGYSYGFRSLINSNPYPRLCMSDYSQYRNVTALLSESTSLTLLLMRDGGVQNAETANNPATIKVVNNAGTGGVVIDGLRSIIMTSSTPNSAKQFKITVDDTGTISATEVTT